MVRVVPILRLQTNPWRVNKCFTFDLPHLIIYLYVFSYASFRGTTFPGGRRHFDFTGPQSDQDLFVFFCMRQHFVIKLPKNRPYFPKEGEVGAYGEIDEHSRCGDKVDTPFCSKGLEKDTGSRTSSHNELVRLDRNVVPRQEMSSPSYIVKHIVVAYLVGYNVRTFFWVFSLMIFPVIFIMNIM
ncbi:hypothetical protein PHYBLDRAFT_62091 [Phycomyces blakesleeanus NRRL 1555(-)]|uniref:Uncharacterized protein n=1 Tax=Phycomyces blakesleeanus (strain ATCC 8743b / DSM 1359 / FGSC 10004 / NBRC 33097 / NRRL 1555) TaxID=763407 RepID=A0A162V9N6_PHYB8|nr:hypothetical protein PHYBLDRAFT_62091 [Phycomyces blakesleeanus NRRL 1555(-)]OAD81042.1 hypothetical protein PHYBLDRAFT_62091 [Phycomyces blakesleeanus NRRL 1555(-)]|eukprot:XP_018299082.1 hypothetical protein PHYBLDRAFT_62091 [Phycomyces blakesleeanus NRRL 1555(-)]